MNASSLPRLLACLGLGASLACSALAAGPKPADLVTVTFDDPDHFTDASERFLNSTSIADLDELRVCVQQTAARLLPAGCHLNVTFLDLDLAGMIRPDKDNLRFMTAGTFPRAHVRFQLVDANGTVRHEGERRLSDTDYQRSIQLIGRNEPLFYDKAMLKDWLAKELKRKT